MLRLIVNNVVPLTVVYLSGYLLAYSIADYRHACERRKQAEDLRQQLDDRVEEIKRFL